MANPLNNSDPKTAEALRYYSSHTAQIEVVRHDRTLEQIVFPIPEICEYLPEDYKERVYKSVEKDDQGSKVADFFSKSDVMFEKMQWQKKLRNSTALYRISKKESFWSYIIFCLSLYINLIVASFYPFSDELPGKFFKDPDFNFCAVTEI